MGCCDKNTDDKPASSKNDPCCEYAKSKANKALLMSAIFASGSHVFCCVLPAIFSLLALLSGFGVIITLPGWLEGLHEHMHEWELPALMFSGVVVVIGWASHVYSRHNDCHDYGCDHGSCQPRKIRTSRILIVASFLFVMNFIVYFGFHGDESSHEHDHAHEHAEEVHDEEHHDGHPPH